MFIETIIKHWANTKAMCLLLVILFFMPHKASAQKQNEQIDAYAKAFSSDSTNNIETFAQALAKPYTTEYDKARVLFAWIGTHIRYDFKKLEAMAAKGFKVETRARSQAEADRKIQENRDAEILKCFKNKRGICEDYSRMYQKMCTAVGLECQFIDGLAKHLSQRTKGMEHAWNTVKIDGKWQLLDATWGAGYCEDETFKAEYSPGFFAVDPHFFILNHLPNDDKWQFLEKPLGKDAFKRQPWFNYGQKTYPIVDVQPLDAALKPQDGNASIKLRFTEKPALIMLSSPSGRPIPYIESQKEGYIVLTFNVSSFSYIYLNVGKTKHAEKFITIGKFYIDL